MANICIFCNRRDIPDGQHRMMVVRGRDGAWWIEFGADCCGDKPLILRSDPETGLEEIVTPNQVFDEQASQPAGL